MVHSEEILRCGWGCRMGVLQWASPARGQAFGHTSAGPEADPLWIVCSALGEHKGDGWWRRRSCHSCWRRKGVCGLVLVFLQNKTGGGPRGWAREACKQLVPTARLI